MTKRSTSIPNIRTQRNRNPSSHAHLNHHHDSHRSRQVGRRAQLFSSSYVSQIFLQLRLTDHSCHKRTDARCQTPNSIPRQLRESPHSTQSMSIRGILFTVEVRGELPCETGLTDAYNYVDRET